MRNLDLVPIGSRVPRGTSPSPRATAAPGLRSRLLRGALLGLLALPACSALEKPPGADTGTGASVVTAPDPTCPVDPDLFTRVDADRAAIETVLRVGWGAQEPVAVRVLYVDVDSGELLATSIADPATSGEQLVLGLRADRTVRLQVEGNAGGERWCSAPLEVQTGSLPADLPLPRVTVDDPERDVRGWQAVAIMGLRYRFAAILDADGEFVWASAVTGLFRAMLSHDGTAMLANTPAGVWNGVGQLHRIPLDGSPETVIDVVGAHTDFVELPDGTLATLGWTVKGFSGDTRWLLGDTILEVRPDGTVEEVWNLFDHVEPFLGTVYAPSPAAGPEYPDLEEWSHVNSITYDAASDDYLVTGTFNHSVMRIDRGTGEMVWMLADEPGISDWSISSEEREIEMPHSAQLVDADTVLVFSRGPVGVPDAPPACAWVTELDLAGSVATPTWHYTSDTCVTVPFLGQARRIEGDNTMVTWTGAGRLAQVDATDTVVLQLDYGMETAFGFGEWVPSLY